MIAIEDAKRVKYQIPEHAVISIQTKDDRSSFGIPYTLYIKLSDGTVGILQYDSKEERDEWAKKVAEAVDKFTYQKENAVNRAADAIMEEVKPVLMGILSELEQMRNLLTEIKHTDNKKENKNVDSSEGQAKAKTPDSSHLDESIETLGISKSKVLSLGKRDIKTIRDLLAASRNHILKARTIGKKYLAYIAALVIRNGYRFDDDKLNEIGKAELENWNY